MWEKENENHIHENYFILGNFSILIENLKKLCKIKKLCNQRAFDMILKIIKKFL